LIRFLYHEGEVDHAEHVREHVGARHGQDGLDLVRDEARCRRAYKFNPSANASR
jgi:hypothetical protein